MHGTFPPPGLQTLICRHPTDLPATARALLDASRDRRVFLLEGDLGAGKTALVGALVAALGSADTASSPTFALAQTYLLGDGSRAHHLDAYRLRDEAEAEEAGLPEVLDSGDWVFVEWPQVLSPWWPERRVELRMDILPDGSRKIVFLVI